MNKILLLTLMLLLFTGCAKSTIIISESEGLNSQIIVTSAIELEGALDSTKVYVIDGMIDMGNTSIIVPVGGLSMVSSSGGAFGISGFTSSEVNYTLFSYINYSGSLFLSGGLEITLTGSNSTIYDLFNDGNFGAVEANEINYNDCSRIGTLDSYRQVLSTNLGIFGCDDGLTFEGTWVGGARITTAIVRGFGANATLFKAGDSLIFNSRFLTDINVDLKDGTFLSDFSDFNFQDDSNFQLSGMTITRNGNLISDDDSFLPNITRANVKSEWSDNIGIQNTFVGGEYIWQTNTVTALTFDTPTKALGTTTYTSLQHYTGIDNNELQYLNSIQKDFIVSGQLVISNGQGDQIEVQIRRYNNETGTTDIIRTVEQKIINSAGNFDTGVFDLYVVATMKKFDTIEIWIANRSDGSDATVLIDSFIVISER